ncbi:MAG: flagellar export protein FliJ [Candidatus Zixiibacteriota bacterium]|nr:MAG: flagellar export protein FliJ [candidate division Zixibacteria bacterium]
MSAKKFKFRFEPLLKVRKHTEKERQKQLATSLKEVQDQQGMLTEMDKERLGATERQRTRMCGPISLAETLVYSRFLVKLKRQRLAGAELLHGLEKEAEQRRRKLVEAARERKIYEMLKEKQQFRHRQEMEKTEQKETDEIASSSFLRQRKRER